MRWDNVVGQDAAVRFMRKALAAGRVPNVLLLWGPKGAGKHVAARALAAAALCADPTGGSEACGECAPCREFAAGVCPDFHAPEVEDAARTIPVELVRGLIADMNLRSVRGGRKVAFVPLAERIQEAQQNTLLKSLEEPPGDSLWIITCEDPARLLPTVRSRATGVRFACPPTERAALAEGEREFLVEYVLPEIGAGPHAGRRLARVLNERVKSLRKSAAAKKKAKKTKKKRKSAPAAAKGVDDGGDSQRAKLEGARRPALEMLSGLALLLRERMRACARAGPSDAGRWVRALEAVLESDAAIRQNVGTELALAVAAIRIASPGAAA